MFCHNCGSSTPDDAKFCPNCASPLKTSGNNNQKRDTTVWEDPAYIPPTDTPPVEFVDTKPKKKKKWLLPFVITLSVFLIAAAGILVWWFTGHGDNATKEATAAPSVPEGICRNCEAELEKGYYCDTCIDELATEAYAPEACIKCAISTLPETKSYYDYSQYFKENKLSKEEIYFIDQNGYLYCKDCESEKLCEACGGYLDPKDDDVVCINCVGDELYEKYRNLTECYNCYEVLNQDEDCDKCMGDEECENCGLLLQLDDDDDLCWECADYYCFNCWEALEEDEVSYTNATEGGDFCSDCDTGKYCEDCDAILGKDDDDEICYYCAEYYCESCSEVLDEDEASYENEVFFGDGGTYTERICKDCDTGKYCEDCGSVLRSLDCDTVCHQCADFSCYDCFEVLEEDEVAYTYEYYDEYSEEYPEEDTYITHYICKHCDTGKYCEDCDRPLKADDDDTVCSDCAERLCSYCYEVLDKESVSYSYTPDYEDAETEYFCKDCDTGKYCEDCGFMLEATHGFSKCYSCADYQCNECGDILNEGEWAYEYPHPDYDYVEYYCNICYSGNHCPECNAVLSKGDDDTLCSGCADYYCWRCYEVLEDGEWEYTQNDPYGYTFYYCSDCYTGIHCSECNDMLDEYDDDSVCWDCADYGCWHCMEVLEEDEISCSVDDVYYCCFDYDTGEYCPDCGRVLKEYNDWECWYCSSSAPAEE